MKESLRPTPILLHSQTLSGAKQHQIPRVLIRHRVVVVGFTAELHGGELFFPDGKEGGLKADRDVLVQVYMAQICAAWKPCVSAMRTHASQELPERHRL